LTLSMHWALMPWWEWRSIRESLMNDQSLLFHRPE
jgi:hypothetical protein